MKKLKIILIVGVLFVLLIFLGIYKNNNMSDNIRQESTMSDNIETEPTTKKWFNEEKIYLTIGSAEAYIIELCDNGVIKTYHGFDENDALDVRGKNFNIEILEQEEVCLKEKDLEKIEDMLEDIKSSKKGKKKIILDAWEYILWIGNEKYYRYLAEGKEDKVVEFIRLIMELSPIYVDLYGMD